MKRRRKSSIVFDIFAGKVVSEVKCSTCGKVSVTEERILDQSVSIPSKKARQRFPHSAAGGSGGGGGSKGGGGLGGGAGARGASRGKKVNGEEDSTSCATTGWFSYLFGMFQGGGGGGWR